MRGYITVVIVGALWIGRILTSLEGYFLLFYTFCALFIKDEQYRDYVLGLWISDDQKMNKWLFGNEDHTISGRVGFESMYNGKYKKTEKVINKLFWFQPNHCQESIEWDEVKNNGR